MATAFRVFGRTLCHPCADAHVRASDLGKMPAGSVIRLSDPTVCAKCGTDWGERDLTASGGGVALCDRCREAARSFAFPAWIKISFAALLAIAAIDFALNFHYLMAVHEAKAAMAVVQADPDRGAALAESALRRVPDSKELLVLAKSVRAISLIDHEHATDALTLLDGIRQLGANHGLFDTVYEAAQIGAAFERKNYDAFLSLSLDVLKRHPNESNALGGVASAYACKFAMTGDDAFKRSSLEFLEAARKRSGADPFFAEYAERIQHRLATREIITASEYHRRFPKKH